MWATTTYWFDLAILYGLLSVGSICFGHFERLEAALAPGAQGRHVDVIFWALLQFGGRQWAWGVMGVLLLVVIYLHAVWLPSKGINGWTGGAARQVSRAGRARRNGVKT